MRSLHIYSMMQPSSEAHHIQTYQIDFDRILCNVLEKYHSFPGFALLLGSLFPSIEDMRRYNLPPGMVTYLYLIRQRGEGYLLDDIGFYGIVDVHGCAGGTQEFLTYLTQLLENPERAGTHVFDQQRYTTAAKECLQLCLCNYRDFSKRATESGHHDRALHRSKPSAWIARMGVRSRIWKARHHFQVLLKASWGRISIEASFPANSPQHEYYRSMSYWWALDLLPFFLENSAISSELAEVLHRCTFTTMAQKFPRKWRLAREAIAKYLLRVESVIGPSMSSTLVLNERSVFHFIFIFRSTHLNLHRPLLHLPIAQEHLPDITIPANRSSDACRDLREGGNWKRKRISLG